MSMQFSILGSGSSGNSALLLTEQARVLIDAGFSARKLDSLLGAMGLSLNQIDAIFLTHEHGDHSAALDGLRRHPDIQVFANAPTAHCLQGDLKHRPSWQIFETGSHFRFKDLDIDAFPVPHDARDPVGFRFSSGHAHDLLSPLRSLVWLTDLGHAPLNIQDRIRDCDALVLEANHCTRLLQADARRPWSTKQRISGRHGHLSNDAMRDLLDSVASPRWKRIFLTHLSSDCNSPQAVEEALIGLRQKLACQFFVVEPGKGTPLCSLD